MNENSALTEATYYILLSLVVPQHGYGIIKQVEELSCGRVHLAAGTLYGAINTMCDRNWIEPIRADEDTRRKLYALTEEGKRVLRLELKRLNELVSNGERILGGAEK